MIGTMTVAHATKTMFDKKKGSFTNRAECAKEHMKNDLSTGARVGAAGALTLGSAAMAVRGGKLKNLPHLNHVVYKEVADKGGKFIVDLKPLRKFTLVDKLCIAMNRAMLGFGKGLGKLAKAVGAKGLAHKIGHNPVKAGVIGLVVAGSLAILSKIADYCTKQGRIDQKYEDAAAIEASTKKVVLA